MQPQLSRNPAPVAEPPAPAAQPKRAPEPPKRSRWKLPLSLLLVAGLGAAGYLLYESRQASLTGTGGTAGAVAVRTAAVSTGPLVQTLRVTGVTAAENFAALTAPTLTGTRSDRVRGIQNTQISSPTGSGGSGVSSRGGSGGSGGGSGAQAAGMGGGSSSMSSSMQSSLSRFSTPSTSRATTSSRTSGSSGSSGSSSVMGSGTGSTASSLPGGSSGPPGVGGASSGGGIVVAGGGGSGGGGGRGGGMFGMVLLNHADAGSRVKKGEVVGEFDRENMLTRLQDFEAVVIQSEASMKKLRAELKVSEEAHKQLIDVAKADLDKARLDLKTAVVRSEIDAERLKLASEEAEARLKQLQAEVVFVQSSLRAQMRVAELDLAQAQSELKRANANLDRMVMKAPMDGIVVMFTTFRGGEMHQIKQGDIVRRGQTFMKIVDTSSMVVDARVNQVDVERIRIGQKAMVRFDAYPELELPAHVYSIGAIAQAPGFMSAYVKEVPVQLRMERVDPRVIPDLSVAVDIKLEEQPDATLVPLNAVFQEAGSSQPYVFVEKGNSWQKQPVEVGPANFVAAAIRSGVRPGDVVATEWPYRDARKKPPPEDPPFQAQVQSP